MVQVCTLLLQLSTNTDLSVELWFRPEPAFQCVDLAFDSTHRVQPVVEIRRTLAGPQGEWSERADECRIQRSQRDR
ncbi:MAG: hypothetical protein ABS63_03600 [Microbacterium sp. SCN 70-27]|nr:MAG: hypothetical protein ABS63_03600 [Microbacterium sp. SCN 70-27]